MTARKPAASKAKATVVDTPATDASEFSYAEMMASLGIEIPSGKQMIAATVTGLATAVLGIYGGVQIAGYVAVGAMLLTGSAFLSFITMTLVAVIAIYSSLIAASRAAAYVASGNLEGDLSRAKNWVTGFFRKEDTLVQAS